MSVRELLETKRDEVLRLAEEHGAQNVRVFGSVARGEADEDSDIDLLVAFRSGTTLLRHAALIRRLRSVLGRDVDVISERGLRPCLRERVLEEAVPL